MSIGDHYEYTGRIYKNGVYRVVGKETLLRVTDRNHNRKNTGEVIHVENIGPQFTAVKEPTQTSFGNLISKVKMVPWEIRTLPQRIR